MPMSAIPRVSAEQPREVDDVRGFTEVLKMGLDGRDRSQTTPVARPFNQTRCRVRRIDKLGGLRPFLTSASSRTVPSSNGTV